ncbi:hypothetical protein R1sor_003232 [Riccia sorocarpa]|uniref:F-box domain-containing protein n=1 Tax=Riccia sorocarpa TaxID=122646 RepID=A0ABD3H4F1_9MARC
MDPEVWKYFPDQEDILRLILCRVSWDTNLRLRSVSKGFYATLSEPSFHMVVNVNRHKLLHGSFRFLFNPLTKGFIKLPVVPKIKGRNSGLVQNHLRIIMAVEKELVTVVAVEFYSYLQPELPRILIWHQGTPDWVLLNVFDPPSTILPVDSMVFFWSGTNAVFFGGELFLLVETEEDWIDGNPGESPIGERVFSLGSRARAIDPELIWSCNNIGDAKTHLFHHKGHSSAWS